MDFVQFITSLTQQCGWSVYQVDSPESVTIKVLDEKSGKPTAIQIFIHTEDSGTFLTFMASGFPLSSDGLVNFTNLLMLELMSRNRVLIFARWELNEEDEFLAVRKSLAISMVTLESFKEAVEEVASEAFEYFNLIIIPMAESELQD